MADFSDDFNRANGGLGANWTTLSGYSAPQISSNHILNSGTTDIGAGHVTTHSVDMGVQATFVYTSTGFQAGSVNARMASLSSTANCYRMIWLNSVGGGTVQLLKRVSGSDSSLATAVAVANGTHTFKIWAITIGSKVVVLGFVDGVLVTRAVDSSSPITTGGYGSCECYNATASQIQIDDFSIVERGVALNSDAAFGTGGYWMGFASGGSDATSGTAKVLVHSTGAFNNVTSYNSIQTDEQLGFYVALIALGAGEYVLCGGTDPTSTGGYTYGMGYGNDDAIGAVETAALEGLSRWTTYNKVGTTAHSAGSYAADGYKRTNPDKVAACFIVDGLSDMDDEYDNQGITIWQPLLDDAYGGATGAWDAVSSVRNPYNSLGDATTWNTLSRIPGLHYYASSDSTFVNSSQLRIATQWGLQMTIAALAGDHSTIHNNVNPATVKTFFDNAKWTDGLPVAAVQAVKEGGTSLGSNNAIALPSRASAGDRVVYVIGHDNPSTTAITASTGWDTPANGAQTQGSNAIKALVVERDLDGTTGDNILSVSGASQDYSVVGLLVKGHDPAEAAVVTATTGSSGNANPPSQDAGSVADRLRIAAAVVDFTTGNSISADPTGYLAGDYQASASSTSSVGTRVAHRWVSNQTEDPPVFTNTSRAWIAYTIAIEQDPGTTTVTTTNVSGTSSTSGTATATVIRKASAAGSSATTGTVTAKTIVNDAVAAGTANTTGTITAKVTVKAILAGSSATTGTATASLAKVATMAGSSATTGTVTATVIRKASAAGSSATSGTATAKTNVNDPVLTGTSATSGVATANVTRQVSAAGSSATSGAATATVTRNATLAGSSATSGTIVATVTIKAIIAGSSATSAVATAKTTVNDVVADGTSTSSGTVTASRVVYAIMAGTSATTGVMVAGSQSTVFATADGSSATSGVATAIVTRNATLAGSSVTSGTVTAKTTVNDVVAAGSSATSGTAVVSVTVKATLTGTSATSGIATAQVTRKAILTGTSATSGVASAKRTVYAIAGGTSNTIGAIVAGGAILATADGSTTTSGTAVAIVRKYATAAGSSATTGVIIARRVGLAQAAGTSSTSGTATARRTVYALGSGVSISQGTVLAVVIRIAIAVGVTQTSGTIIMANYVIRPPGRARTTNPNTRRSVVYDNPRRVATTIQD